MFSLPKYLYNQPKVQSNFPIFLLLRISQVLKGLNFAPGAFEGKGSVNFHKDEHQTDHV